MAVNCSACTFCSAFKLKTSCLILMAVSGPGAPCVGPGALCQGPAPLVSGPGAVCRGSASGPGGPLQRPFLSGGLCVGPRRFLSGPSGLALCVSGPGALCVGPARGPRSSCRSLALFVSGPGALCQGVCGARAVSVSELGALQRSLYRRPALCGGLSVSGLCRRLLSEFVSGPGGLAVSVSGRGAVSVRRRSLCRRPALFVSGPGALRRVGPRRSLCWAPALFVSGPGFVSWRPFL